MELYNPPQQKRPFKRLFKAALLGPLHSMATILTFLFFLVFCYDFITTNGNNPSLGKEMLVGLPVTIFFLTIFSLPFSVTLGIPIVLLLEENDITKPWQYFLIGGVLGSLIGALLFTFVFFSGGPPVTFTVVGLVLGLTIGGTNAYFSARIYFKP